MNTTLAERESEIDEIVTQMSKNILGDSLYKLFDFLYKHPTVDTLECFLKKGVDFNAKPSVQSDPLWFSLIRDHHNPQLLERILQTEVDVHERISRVGTTALLIAAKCHSPKFCEILLDNGALVSEADSGGWQPIHCAAFENVYTTLNYLISRGANVNSQTALGYTPLHLIAMNTPYRFSTSRTLQSLVRAGADVNALDSNGRNAIYIAIRYGHLAILFDLVTCGTKFQIFNSYGMGFWEDLHVTYLSTTEIDRICVLYYMSGGLANWKPDMPHHDCAQTRLWSSCTRIHHPPEFSEQCDQVISRHDDEIVTICVGLQSLELPSLVLCEIIFEVLSFWGRLKFCEIWNRIVAVRHFHERHLQNSFLVANETISFNDDTQHTTFK